MKRFLFCLTTVGLAGKMTAAAVAEPVAPGTPAPREDRSR